MFSSIGSISEPLAHEGFGNERLLLTCSFLLFFFQPDLCFLLVSGRTGSPVGRPVKYNIVGVGNLIGPQVYITTSGAVYILFGFGKKQGWLWFLLPWCRWLGLPWERTNTHTGVPGVGSFSGHLTYCGSLTMLSLDRLDHFPITPSGTSWSGLYWTHVICCVSPAQNPTLG